MNLDPTTRLDSIIRQGKELGTHVYIYTGGEPLVRKRDRHSRCARPHPDCAFLCVHQRDAHRRGVLPGHAAREELHPRHQRGRRSKRPRTRGAATGTYGKVVARHATCSSEHGLPFGVSCCYTQPKRLVDRLRGVLRLDDRARARCSAWIFTYMPVGVDAPTDLMASADAARGAVPFRAAACAARSRCSRSTSGTTASSWAAASPEGGATCTSMRPATWSPACSPTTRTRTSATCRCWTRCARPSSWPTTSSSRSTTTTLRPCPTLDNAGILADMVDRAGAHSTDLQHAEDAHDLCAKCAPAAEEWAPVAERLWTNPDDPLYQKRHDPGQGLGDTDKTKLERLGRGHQPLAPTRPVGAGTGGVSERPRCDHLTQKPAGIGGLLLFCLLFASTGPPKVSEKRSACRRLP